MNARDMDLPFAEISAAFQRQKWSAEIERERERQCGFNEEGLYSRQKITENYTGNVIVRGSSSSSVSPPSLEAEPNNYLPVHGGAREGSEQLNFIELFGSLKMDDGVDSNFPADPWGIWSQPTNNGFHSRPLPFHAPSRYSGQEISASLIPPQNLLLPCRWQQTTAPSLGNAQYSGSLSFQSEYPLQRTCDVSRERYSRSYELSNVLPASLSSLSDDSLILPGKVSYSAARRELGVQRERREGKLKISPRYFASVNSSYQSLWGIRGYMNLVARDQQGCRFLQKKFGEGTMQEREMIFMEIIDHAPDLMVNPFGNYLVQKVLEVCSEDQMRDIVLVLTRKPSELVKIALNVHGTRAVQRLIEYMKDRSLISLVISALKPGFVNLMKDPNGNHVIQRCLQHFSMEDNKIIFEVAARHCVEITTHKHGCCVLQKCIAFSNGQLQSRLLYEVSVNGLMLAQDDFGNYAVQFVLEMKDDRATEELKRQFKGSYVHLARQKCSSNVVEKCFNFFDDASRRRIVRELLSVSNFDHLLQDPYANYVIQAALVTSKGQIRNSLVEAIRPHEDILKTSPYSKKIYTLLHKR